MTSLTDLKRNNSRGRLARPEKASRGAVIVLPSAAGFNAFHDGVLNALAGAGFHALAWDPFVKYGEVSQEERGRISAEEMKDSEIVLEHRDWVGFLLEQSGVQTIGALGFCMGGRHALLLAAEDKRVNAAVGFYPTMRDPKPAVANDLPAIAPKIAGQVLVHCPGKDHLTSRASFERLRQALESRESGTTAMNWYPKAHHGFYGKTAAQDKDDYEAGLLAWPVTMAFLSAALA
jgi:carboxymethylenebutenolidase